MADVCQRCGCEVPPRVGPTDLQIYDFTVVENARESEANMRHLLAAAVEKNGGVLRVPEKAVNAHLRFSVQRDAATNEIVLVLQ